jgi:hypothetical protein
VKRLFARASPTSALLRQTCRGVHDRRRRIVERLSLGDVDRTSEVRRWRTAAERARSSEAEEPSFGARGDAKVGATMPRSCSTSSRTAEARLICCQTLREAGAQSRLAGISLSRERRTSPACHRLQADVRGRVAAALAAFRYEGSERVAQPHTIRREPAFLGAPANRRARHAAILFIFAGLPTRWRKTDCP